MRRERHGKRGQRIGRGSQVIGAVVDVEFPSDQLPDLNNAITVELGDGDQRTRIVLEAAQHLGNNTVRCVAMSSTDGLQRGAKAVDTGRPISVPVGEGVLGRVFNVLGETIDGRDDEVKAVRVEPIHRPAPAVDEVEPADEMLETGIKVVDLLAPYARGGKIGLFGGPVSVRRFSSWNSSVTWPKSTVDIRSFPVWESGPGKEMNCIMK